MLFNLKKFNKIKLRFNRGMTYVELIVVLSIFAIMSAVSLFNYREFQARVEIKKLATDIALQIVGAQKNAMAGQLPAVYSGSLSSSWKPAYGIYFESTQSFPMTFTYFADTNNSNTYDPTSEFASCPGDAECLDRIEITKKNKIKELIVDGGVCAGNTSELSIIFERPDSRAVVSNDNGVDCSFSKATIVISSEDESISANIEVYPSGRIQITN
ncbi:MAG: type II secretion system protein [Patescibacteria group bacterium]